MQGYVPELKNHKGREHNSRVLQVLGAVKSIAWRASKNSLFRFCLGCRQELAVDWKSACMGQNERERCNRWRGVSVLKCVPAVHLCAVLIRDSDVYVHDDATVMRSFPSLEKAGWEIEAFLQSENGVECFQNY